MKTAQEGIRLGSKIEPSGRVLGAAQSVDDIVIAITVSVFPWRSTVQDRCSMSLSTIDLAEPPLAGLPDPA